MGNLTAAETEYMIAHQSDNKGPQIIASNVICLTATIIAFVLRFVSRRLGHVKLGIEDWLIVIATVSAAHKSDISFGKIITVQGTHHQLRDSVIGSSPLRVRKA